MKEVAQLGAGSYFGELSLTTEKPRTATIMALESMTDVAVMGKDTYDRVIGRAMQKRIED